MDNPNGLKNVVLMVVFPHFLSLNYILILQTFYKLKNDQHPHVFLMLLFQLLCSMKLILSWPMFLDQLYSHVHYNIKKHLMSCG